MGNRQSRRARANDPPPPPPPLDPTFAPDLCVDVACLVMRHLDSVRDRASLLCASRVFREAGKRAESLPTSLDFAACPRASGKRALAFMRRITGISRPRSIAGKRVTVLTVPKALLLDRARLAGCQGVTKKHLAGLDVYVRHRRRSARPFLAGPFDLWPCVECDKVVDDEGGRACVCCPRTRVFCTSCQRVEGGETVCAYCNDYACSYHDPEEYEDDLVYCVQCDKAACLNCAAERDLYCIGCDAMRCDLCTDALTTCMVCEENFCEGCWEGLWCTGSNPRGCGKATCHDCLDSEHGHFLQCEACEGYWCRDCKVVAGTKRGDGKFHHVPCVGCGAEYCDSCTEKLGETERICTECENLYCNDCWEEHYCS